VKYWRGPTDEVERPYLLEVNTRAAGGLFHTTLAGVNLAWACVKVALGELVEVPEPVFGAAYTQLAALVPLDPEAPGSDESGTGAAPRSSDH
jgi:hypothetical protein